MQVLEKLQSDQIKFVDVKKERQDAYNEYTRAVHKDLVWSGSCQSWCKSQNVIYRVHPRRLKSDRQGKINRSHRCSMARI